MTITIYHNLHCSKSRETLEILRERGIEPVIIDYLDNPPTLAELENLYAALRLDTALPMVRVKEAEFKETGLSKNSSDKELLAAIAKYPKLLERPIVITPKGARICRPPEVMLEIL